MAIYDPYKAMQEARLRDPSLDLSAQATPYIGEGGGVGGKGGGRADDPGDFDDFGRNDPYGSGLLYRMPSQRDPGIVADLQRQVEQNRLGSILSGLMGRGGGDTPPLDTGYKIDVNVVADLVKGLTGSPDRTPTGQAAVTESPTTQSQLSPEAQAQSQAQNISIIAEMLREAEEVKKRNPQFTDPYAGLEGKIASLDNVTTDQGGGQLADTAITPLRETLDVDSDLLEKAQYDARVKSGEIVPPPDDKADAAELERLFSEISKTPIRPWEYPSVRPAIDETQLRQDFLPQPPPGKPWDQLTEEEQQDLYNKAIEQGKKKEATAEQQKIDDLRINQLLASMGFGPGEFDPLKPPPPEGVLANLMHLFKDPGFQRLAGTGLIAAIGGPGRGRQAKAFTDVMDAAAERRLKQAEIDAVRAGKVATAQTAAQKAKQETIKTVLKAVTDGLDPQLAGEMYGLSQIEIDKVNALASKFKTTAISIDPLTGDRHEGTVEGMYTFRNPKDANKMSFDIKKLNKEGQSATSPLGKLISDHRAHEAEFRRLIAIHNDKENPEKPFFGPAGTALFKQMWRDSAIFKKTIEQQGMAEFEKMVSIVTPHPGEGATEEELREYQDKKIRWIKAGLIKKTYIKPPMGMIFNAQTGELRVGEGLVHEKAATKEGKEAESAVEKMDNAIGSLHYAHKINAIASRATVGAGAQLKNFLATTEENIRSLVEVLKLDEIFGGPEVDGVDRTRAVAQEINTMLQESRDILKNNYNKYGQDEVESGKESEYGDLSQGGGLGGSKIRKAGESTANISNWFDPNISILNAMTISLAIKMAGMAEPGKLTDDDINRQFKIIYGGRNPATQSAAEYELKTQWPKAHKVDPNMKSIEEKLFDRFHHQYGVAYPGKPFWAPARTFEEYKKGLKEGNKTNGKQPNTPTLRGVSGSLAQMYPSANNRQQVRLIVDGEKIGYSGSKAGSVVPMRLDQIQQAIDDGLIYSPYKVDTP
jgi:hypothetical protein